IVAFFRHSTRSTVGSQASSPSVPSSISRTESTAIRLATSPASAPPIPSETTSTSPFWPNVKRVSFSGGVAPSAPVQVCSADKSSTRKLSSLPRRTRPTSDLAYNSTIIGAVSYTHLRAHETPEHLVCRLLLEKKKKRKQ